MSPKTYIRVVIFPISGRHSLVDIIPTSRRQLLVVIIRISGRRLQVSFVAVGKQCGEGVVTVHRIVYLFLFFTQ